MKIATWNVNSVRARAERLLRWLDADRPEVVCRQELKALGDDFPRIEAGGLGYQAAVFGQKAYHGVEVLSRLDLADVCPGLCDRRDDTQAHLISTTVAGMRHPPQRAPRQRALRPRPGGGGVRLAVIP